MPRRPLARLGAVVVGVDATEENVHVAACHARRDPRLAPRLSYRYATVEALVAEGLEFDVVVASEVVEHVACMATFVRDCAAAVKPGGLLLLSTLNRTRKAYALGVVAAEQVLGWAPPGTHDHAKFVQPEELCSAAAELGLTRLGLSGMKFSVPAQRWELSADTDINYIAAFAKPGPHPAPVD